MLNQIIDFHSQGFQHKYVILSRRSCVPRREVSLLGPQAWHKAKHTRMQDGKGGVRLGDRLWALVLFRPEKLCLSVSSMCEFFVQF